MKYDREPPRLHPDQGSQPLRFNALIDDMFSPDSPFGDQTDGTVRCIKDRILLPIVRHSDPVPELRHTLLTAQVDILNSTKELDLFDIQTGTGIVLEQSNNGPIVGKIYVGDSDGFAVPLDTATLEQQIDSVQAALSILPRQKS